MYSMVQTESQLKDNLKICLINNNNNEKGLIYLIVELIKGIKK